MRPYARTMHILALRSTVTLTPSDVIPPGEYVVEDMSGAQLLVMAGGGSMRPMTGEKPLDSGLFNGGAARILIMRVGGFGDLVLLTPVLREIKRRWPDCVLHVSTMSHYAPVLAGLPYVDAVVPYPVPYTEALAYDAHIFYENAIENNPRAQKLHATELFGEIAGLTGIPDLHPDYRVKATEAIWAAEQYPRVNGTRRLCIQVGASAKCRVYPRDKMGQVAMEMLKRGWEVFLMGEEGEIKLPDRMPKGLRNISDDGLSFRQSCAVASQADCVLGNDSAMIHVAGALNIPAVALYSPFPWALRTKHSPSITALSGVGACAPCFHHATAGRHNHFPENCPSASKGFCGVLAEIKPERVVATIERVARQPAGPVASVVELPGR